MEIAQMNKIKEEKEQLIKLATQQQMSASNPNKSVWVEASAGTGKTKVLSDRVLRLLLANVNPSKILCLTYTKAAAVEMNERITNRLSKWAIEKDEDLEKELSKLLGVEFNNTNKTEVMSFARTLFAILLDTPGGMKIQTIHSFCQDILKRFPLEAGISPYFEVMDDPERRRMLNKCWEKKYLKANFEYDFLRHEFSFKDFLVFCRNAIIPMTRCFLKGFTMR
jgi:ATP-dependent helicase/nuclease subunit A